MLSVGAKITFLFQNKKGGFAAYFKWGYRPKSSVSPIKHVIYYGTYAVLIRYAPHTLLLKIKSN
jgi:hypothetical protein